MRDQGLKGDGHGRLAYVEVSDGTPMEHPERPSVEAIEPSVGELLALRSCLEGIEMMDTEQLKEQCRSLAHLAMVSYPAALRWTVRSLAGNLRDKSDAERICQALAEQVKSQRGPEGPPLAECG